ncbi:two-component system response regulator [Leptolyngbya valderiana BDU 20041]|uniref:response regulator transcription factor n=1 Tax=Baaleninema simplex TaxID=2862350 RepID=UPI0003479652|nr:response regulator [Baaleninema simplex]MDC0835471.1 response regulator [Geitlerinema sp. CS-897]OAB60814.1 two-component system response regulator [Leptolyngbya valderiana BDU 20041]
MKHVFVVEDGHAEQKMIEALLKQAGFQVTLSSSVDEAWDKLQSGSPPDLFVLDIVMPGKSGLELCRTIRENEQLQDIPVVFCSSKSEEFDRFWAMRQGAQAYLVKPYAPKELLDVVYQHVK